MKATKPLHLPETLPASHADLLKLKDEIKTRARELRKAGDKKGAAALAAFNRRVRRAERATRKGAPKAKAAKKAPTKEGAPLKKAA